MLETIKKAFADSGWSLKRLADKSGVPYGAIHPLFRGTRDPQLSTVERVCTVLGLGLRPMRRKTKESR